VEDALKTTPHFVFRGHRSANIYTDDVMNVLGVIPLEAGDVMLFDEDVVPVPMRARRPPSGRPVLSGVKWREMMCGEPGVGNLAICLGVVMLLLQLFEANQTNAKPSAWRR
jgi:hypothetical protein